MKRQYQIDGWQYQLQAYGEGYALLQAEKKEFVVAQVKEGKIDFAARKPKVCTEKHEALEWMREHEIGLVKIV